MNMILLDLHADFITQYLFLYNKTRFEDKIISTTIKFDFIRFHKSFFATTMHDLIMNFLLNRFHTKNKKFMIETNICAYY